MDKYEKALEYQHNNPQKPFNPLYSPYAASWSLLATYDLSLAGVYKRHSRDECAGLWAAAYDARKAQGAPTAEEVNKAHEYLYNID